MKKTLTAVVSVFIACSSAFAQTDGPGLIIAKSGAAISAESTRVEGANVHYVAAGSKSEKVVPVADIIGIIPYLERGVKYSDQKIGLVLELIKTVKSKHPELRRKLNVIESDWIVAGKPVDPGLAKEIDAVVQQFNQSTKGESAYKRATTALGMIRFKDKTGSQDAVVDKALADMKIAYLGFDLPALLARGDAEKFSKAELSAYRAEAIEAIKGKTTEKEKLALKEAFAKARETTIRGCIAEIEAFFDKYKAVSVYHKSVEDLRAIKEEICKEDSDFELVKKSDEKMFGIMKEQYKGYDFSFNKFPISPKDQAVLKVMKPFSSLQPVKGVKEECYMVPVRLPYKPMPVANKTVVPFIFLFNRAQSPASEYSTVLSFKDAGGSDVTQRSPVPPPQLVHARMATRLALDFTKAGEAGQGLEDGEGLHVLLRLDIRDKSKAGSEWMPISNACRIPVSPAEDKE